MNVEICKVANGYLVRPVPDYYKDPGRGFPTMERVWVFNNYPNMIDKLDQILQMDEEK